MFCVSRMWVWNFYNVKQKYPNHSKRLPAVLTDIGKIAILQNILVTEIALIFHLLENVAFLHDSAHHSEVWQANSCNPYLIFLLIVSGEKSSEKSKTGSILKPQQFQQLPKWCTQTTPRTHFSKKR